jgi:hypothetical protein
MISLDLEHIERQLKKRLDLPYTWFQKQNDLWDTETKFIYKIKVWEELLTTIEETQKLNNFSHEPYFNYAINRWYNFWSAQAAEHIFTCLPGFASNPKPLENQYDFKWLGIPIDHKTSVFPKGYEENYAFAKANKSHLIQWFYNQQSTGQRYHLNNRLFIVVYAENGEHWKLKADIDLLKKAIEPYGKNHTPAIMQTLNLEEGKETLADIIWVTQ